MTDSPRYKFVISLGYSGADREYEFDLVEEGYVESLEEWREFDESLQVEILTGVLVELEAEVVESWWEEV